VDRARGLRPRRRHEAKEIVHYERPLCPAVWYAGLYQDLAGGFGTDSSLMDMALEGENGVEGTTPIANASTTQYDGHSYCYRAGWTKIFELPQGISYVLDLTAGADTQGTSTLVADAGIVLVNETSGTSFWLDQRDMRNDGVGIVARSPPVNLMPITWLGGGTASITASTGLHAETTFHHAPWFFLGTGLDAGPSSATVTTPDGRPLTTRELGAVGPYGIGENEVTSDGEYLAQLPPGSYAFDVGPNAQAGLSAWILFGADVQFPGLR
jgi:hypothetical protein